MTAKTPSQRQREYVQRLKDAGLFEVRGIYLPRTLHPEIREYARKIKEKAS